MITVFWTLAIVILVAGIASALYLNTLFNLLDRTEITGDPNLAESDLLDAEDMTPAPNEIASEVTNVED